MGAVISFGVGGRVSMAQGDRAVCGGFINPRNVFLEGSRRGGLRLPTRPPVPLSLTNPSPRRRRGSIRMGASDES